MLRRCELFEEVQIMLRLACAPENRAADMPRWMVIEFEVSKLNARR